MKVYLVWVYHTGSGKRFIDTTWARVDAAEDRKTHLEASFSATGSDFHAKIVAGKVEDVEIAGGAK